MRDPSLFQAPCLVPPPQASGGRYSQTGVAPIHMVTTAIN